MLKVKFKKDYEMSPDGINTRMYKAGQTYEATHGHEHNMFQHAIYSGIAENKQEAGKSQVKNKVTTPTKRKRSANK